MSEVKDDLICSLVDKIYDGVNRSIAMIEYLESQLHYYNEGDAWYSCAQSLGDGWDKSTVPGDGCADDERAGGPCDCGRDDLIAKAREILGVPA